MAAAHCPALEGADPAFPLPPGIHLHSCCKKQRRAHPEFKEASEVSEEEFCWMEARRPLQVTPESLKLDYGVEEAGQMEQAFAEAELSHLLGTLNWPGIGTRWREFLEWCQSQGRCPESPEVALRGFGRYLGRVTTYRALAIDDAALQSIFAADCIFPSGQLRVGSEALEHIVNTKGIRMVCVARLFIAHLQRLLGHDPSISLHDDWQTTSLIASGYATRGKKVHLFELSCPKVESIGWTLQEVAQQSPGILGPDYADHDPWFCFPAPAVPGGVWFDGRWQRTERYGLYGVPFLSMRMMRLFVFNSVDEIGSAVLPFAHRQSELHAADTGCEPPPPLAELQGMMSRRDENSKCCST